MDINVAEIRMLLGICVRGLHDVRDDETNNLTPPDRMEIQEISEKAEEAYDALRPWAPDEW